jgi:hypothetical protein
MASFSPFSFGGTKQTQQFRPNAVAAPAPAPAPKRDNLADYISDWGSTTPMDWSSIAPYMAELGIDEKGRDGARGWQYVGGNPQHDSGGQPDMPWQLTQEARQKLAGYTIGDREQLGKHNSQRAIFDPSGKQLGASQQDESKSMPWIETAVPLALAAMGARAVGGALGGAGAAGEGAAVGNGAFLGEGVASGIPAWDAAAGLGELGTGALGLEGATYALPGAEAGLGVMNAGAAAEGAALGNGAFLGEGVASGIPAWDAAAGLGAAAGGAGAGGLGSMLGKAGSAIGGAASSIGNFLTENPGIGSVVKGAGAALGAGLASKALAGNPPTAPSAAETSATQSAANLTAAQQQAQLNRVDTTTPFGFQKFGSVDDPSVPGGKRYTQEIGFSPQQQAIYDAETSNQLASQKTAQGMQGRVADAVANPFSLASTPAAESAMKGDAFSADRDAVTKSLFDRLTRLRGPQMAQEKEALDTKLRNQGLMPGTVAYDNGMRSLVQAQQTELSDQADRALLAGGAEQTRLQTDSRANAGFNNQNRSQSIQEQLLQRQQPLAEYNAFRTGNTPTLPTFQPFGMSSVAPTNTAAAANAQYQSQADAYNAQIARMQALLNFGTTVAKGG